MRRATALAFFFALGSAGAAAWWGPRYAWDHGASRRFGVHDTVVFVVLDTVRADHSSLCGYDRETTPTLAALAKAGATYTCRSYAPGTWTVPSHASFFTGATVLEHGAHELPRPDGDVATGTHVPCAPLDGKLPTLAETMKAKGYRTLMVSQNPVVTGAMGLTRGFDHTFTATQWHQTPGDAWPELLEAQVREGFRGADEKLFLFLNIAEAHGPWWEARKGEPFPGRRLWYNLANPHNAWRRWYDGNPSEAEKAQVTSRLHDAYDLGVWRADHALGLALARLRDLGVCGDDCRVVVVGDHGEMLGEHDAIDHGFVPWEGNQRVPLLVAGPDAPAVPEPVSGREVYDLLTTGAFPAERKSIEAAFWPHAGRWERSNHRAYGSRGLMWWSGAEKWTWTDATWTHHDVVADPGERIPLGGEPPPEALKAAEAVAAVPDALGTDPTVTELLKAAGYVE